MIEWIASDGISICREKHRREEREEYVTVGEVFQERSFAMGGREMAEQG